MTIAEELREWAKSNAKSTSQARFALEVAEALGNDQAKTHWSMINLRDEFEARSSERRGVWTSLSAVSSVMFVLPILLAWLHLGGAFSAYRAAVRLAGSDQSINFLAFWSGAYEGESWGFRGATASAVAGQVFLAVIVIIGLQVVLGSLEYFTARQNARLDDLILRASLEFGKKRAIRPEELAGEIRVAARELEKGLENLRTAFEQTKELVDEVKAFSGAISGSALVLKEASDGLKTTMEPLSKFTTTAGQAEEMLRTIVDALEAARSSFAEGARQQAELLSQSGTAFRNSVTGSVGALDAAGKVIEVASRGLSDVVDSSLAVPQAIANIRVELDEALASVVKSVAKVTTVAERVESVATSTSDAMREVSASANSPEVASYVVAVREAAALMADSTKGLQEAVQHVSNEIARWNGEADA